MSEPTPEYYGEVYYLRSTPWGMAITFGVEPSKEGVQGHDVCVVRLSQQTAKTLSMLVRKQLKKYERDTATVIAIPQGVMNNLGLAPEDW